MPKFNHTQAGTVHVTVSRQYNTRNDGHPEIMDMIADYDDRGFKTSEIVDMAMLALYDRWSKGETPALGSPSTAIPREVLDAISDMREIQKTIMQLLAQGNLDTANVQQLQNQMQRANDKLSTIEGAGNYAGGIVLDE